MAIYESRGFGNDLHRFDPVDPFKHIATFGPMRVPQGADINDFKRNHAPYCISGEVKQDENGNYKRNNASLLYRDLIFLDYDELEASTDFPRVVHEALQDYSYTIYPTIKHTAEKPRYRLVVKPTDKLDEQTYKATAQKIVDKIGLAFDRSSLTWSQLQGLPVTTGDPADYERVVNRGRPYPVAKTNTVKANHSPNYHTPRQSGDKSLTMRVIDTLLHGFGDEGGRNIAVTRFVGLLLSKWVDADIEVAYNLTVMANNNTETPLPQEELDRVFDNIVEAEINKRRINGK